MAAGARSGVEPVIGQDRITLCMIVRDEARFLPGCLESVQDVVDDMVIVDTGSTDETVSIAQAAGARVVRASWQDDFAAARNAALPYVDGGFLLVLDADERLAPGVGVRIRGAVRNRQVDCWMLPLHNASTVHATPDDVLAGRDRMGGVTYLPRLLRRTPDLHWEGVVHENPRSWLAAPDRGIKTLDAPIVHYGYASSVVEERDKIARNHALLEARCAAEPGLPDPRIYLAKGLMGEKRFAEAFVHLQAAWDLARGLPDAEIRRPIIEMMASSTLRILARRPAEEARPYVADVLAWGLDHPNVAYHAGIARERMASRPASPAAIRRDDLEHAASLYERGLSWAKVPLLGLIPRVQSTLLPLRLGIVRCKLGDALGALRVLQPAVRAHPDDAALTVALAEAQVERGAPAQALKTLEPVLAGGPADAWCVGARAAAGLGERDLADDFVRRAHERGTPREHHRRRWVATPSTTPVGAP